MIGAGAQKRRPPERALQAASKSSESRLRGLHRGGDGVEGGADLRAEPTGCGDDANGNQGGDEAILDGCRARLVLYETLNVVLHDALPKCWPTSAEMQATRLGFARA